MICKHTDRSVHFRIALVFICFMLAYLIVALRLVQLQILNNQELSSMAKRQYEKVGKTASYRLPIFDRTGEELAVSVPSVSIFARPRLIRNKAKASRVLSGLMGKSPEHWLKKLQSKKPFVWLQRQIPAELAREIERKRLSGVFFETENKRVYPNGSLAAHVVGFTDIDGNGITGIELALNQGLSSKFLEFLTLRDGKGMPSYIVGRKPDGSRNGAGIYLTLDRRLQHVLEEELEKSMLETKAKAVFGIIMEPQTGEVLAMAQVPTFDPNHFSDYPASSFTNRMISHLFEPGSTLKVLFGAEAIQEGILNKNTAIDCNHGKLTIGKRTISEADIRHRFGTIPFHKVIRYSSNIGAVKIIQALGADRTRSGIQRFGLTSKTGIQLPGEVSSAPKSDSFWKPVFLATVGFGQGIAITPLQLIASFAPFANGGFWVRPRIVMGRSDTSDSSRLDMRRVFSLKTVESMRQILVSVTEQKDGTGTAARVPNVKVAGKTGTAQKYVTGQGYGAGKYFSSFVGFLPADKPELLIGVMVDEPEKDYYASQVAAPLFSRVAERALQYIGHSPTKAVAGVTPLQRQNILRPLPELELESRADGEWIMPDLFGISLGKSLSVIGKMNANLKVDGFGYVTEQSPKPGTLISSKSPIHLRLSPQPEQKDISKVSSLTARG